jgi:hypothetical protein
MIYRILKAPPGYSAEQKYLVAAYETLDFDSPSHYLTNKDGGKFAASLDEARCMVPSSAKSLPFEPVNQFVELWEG